MTKLQQHIDDLDRMIDGGAAKADLRSQLAFIGREIAAFEADYERLASAHSALAEAATKETERQAKPRPGDAFTSCDADGHITSFEG